MTGIREKLAAIFQAEHAEHLGQIRSILALLENVSEAQGRSELDEAFRRAHSLKGAARAVDLPPVEGLAQGLETLFSRVREGTLPLNKKTVTVIHQVLDSSEDCLAGIRENRIPEHPAAALRAMAELLGDEAGLLESPPLPEAAKTPTPVTVQRTEMLRVEGGDLDRLVRSTGQILTESLRQKAVTLELFELMRQIKEMESDRARSQKTFAASWQRFAGTAESSALTQNTRVVQQQFVQQKVRSLVGQSRKVCLLQQRVAWSLQVSAERLQRDVWKARMAPVEDLFEGFRKMVRDLARDEKKEIEFRLNGSDVRADRLVLQALKDPVMHLLRNAIRHGIETPGERVSKGKSPVGSLTVNVESQRGRLVIEVEDDGRGVDFDRVAKLAIEQGVISATVGTPSQDLARILFQPGFSTCTTVTDLSGRGMGLSVVHETVRRLQGDVDFRQKVEPGASILLSVPLSVSTFHMVLVSCQGQTFGIPSHGIERLHRVNLQQVETLEGKPVVNLRGRRIALFSLANLLRIGDGAAAFTGATLPVMLLRSGARYAAVWVDRFLEEREALVQELGMPCPATGNVSGGLLLRDGTVSMVLNPAGLVETSAQSAAPVLKRAQPVSKVAVSSILVVDDSITTRSLEKSILEAHGYRVRVAVDGVEALQLLRAESADLVIADIEMPRLDGFGLLEAMKADKHLDRIPVIIVSSLDRAEHRQRGLGLGADAYVVKRKFDQRELLDAVQQYL
ncbi:MAG: CheA signal transduction histidine kinase [Candidatus Solibacter sp.]|nr:CheA signal transduction histidine kinase [Candidatus Solibacter sp.]